MVGSGGLVPWWRGAHAVEDGGSEHSFAGARPATVEESFEFCDGRAVEEV